MWAANRADHARATPGWKWGRCPFFGVRIASAPEDLAHALRSAEAALRSLIRAIRVLGGMQPGLLPVLDQGPRRVDQPSGMPAAASFDPLLRPAVHTGAP